MSISSITSSPSYSNPAIQEEQVKSSSQQQPAQLPGTDGQDAEDTVHLSEGAQVEQMAQQGESASAIASSTGLTASEVDSDLGISTTSSSVAVTAPRDLGREQPAVPAATSDSKTATPVPTLLVNA